VWHTLTGRLVTAIPVLSAGAIADEEEYDTRHAIRDIAWCPINLKIGQGEEQEVHRVSMLAVAAGRQVVIVEPGVASRSISEYTRSLFDFGPADVSSVPHITWEMCSGRKARGLGTTTNEGVGTVDEEVSDHEASEEDEEARDKAAMEDRPGVVPEADLVKDSTAAARQPYNRFNQIVLRIHHPKAVNSVAWHRQGDYLVATCPQAVKTSVVVHQMTKRRSQIPFTKYPGGQVVDAQFVPRKAELMIATQKGVRIFDLKTQNLVKRLLPGLREISSVAMHPTRSNHIAVTGNSAHVSLHDTYDHDGMPHKKLRYHKGVVSSTAFHPKYPLMATGSRDGTTQVLHFRSYGYDDEDDDDEHDITSRPTIVPVAVLRPTIVPVAVLRVPKKAGDGHGVMDIAFHPVRPWIATVHRDATVRLWFS
ncbi:hypothetical protein KIPB_008611, partial [Kipferlia bialata]